MLVACGHLAEHVMRVMETTAKSMAQLQAQQDSTAKQLAALQQAHAAATLSPAATPTPGTPNGAAPKPQGQACRCCSMATRHSQH